MPLVVDKKATGDLSELGDDFSCKQQNPYFMKKRLLGTLFGFLALFGFGAIYYGILTADEAAAMMAAYELSLIHI